MAAFSLRGYCRTLSERIACTPAITIKRLTTIARTGRRMNRSVNLIGTPRARSLVHWLRRQLGAGSEVVPHHHRGAVAKLERAAAHDRLARLETRDDGHQVSAALARADELLVRDQGGVAGVVALLLQREHGVPVRRVEDCR